jgi:hypothetical protein
VACIGQFRSVQNGRHEEGIVMGGKGGSEARGSGGGG